MVVSQGGIWLWCIGELGCCKGGHGCGARGIYCSGQNKSNISFRAMVVALRSGFQFGLVRAWSHEINTKIVNCYVFIDVIV